jgi:hypothetical protein
LAAEAKALEEERIAQAEELRLEEVAKEAARLVRIEREEVLTLDSGCVNSDTEWIYNTMKNPRYEFFDEKMTWSAAEDFCVSMDGHLVSIQDDEQNDQLHAMAG